MPSLAEWAGQFSFVAWSRFSAMVRSNAALYEHGARSLDQVTSLSTAYQQVLVTLRDVVRSASPEDMRRQVELRKAYSSLVSAEPGFAGVVGQLAGGTGVDPGVSRQSARPGGPK